jgi:hypothetical protein
MRITISDGTDIILDREVLDDAKLPEFDKHKNTLVGRLRSLNAQNPKSKPFDAHKASGRLTAIARLYLTRGSAKQAMTPAHRRERLLDIARKLSETRRLVGRTMKTDVRGDLFSAWWEVAGSEYANPEGICDPRYMNLKFEEMVKALADLEAAASYGARHVTASKRGKHSIVSRDDLWNLAALYRDSTGLKAGAGHGPFAEFVWDFLSALGSTAEIEYDSMIEAIKRVRRWALTHPVARKWRPSPFDEEL